ncbi:MAG TPA: Calx-beta domain-containing protein [Sedimentisphaerales bacterium]|nr:Calx-beta domain-containing protein [Sedimentisphaerales bacterium]
MLSTKRFYLLLGCILVGGLAVGQARGADLFSDGFESGNFTTGGWTIQNSYATVNTRSVYTGTYGAEAAMTTWIEKALSTVGYETIHVKYYRDINRFDSGEYLYVEWYDGSSWNPLETTNNGDYSDGLQDKVCGAGANENANFKLRFRTNANKSNEYAWVDDVVVSGTGTAPDTDPPTPNPATFASPPAAVSSSEITMTATTGSDASPPVYYYFDETSENPGGTDSGWTTNPVYNDTGLNPNTQYTYTVQMRDSLLNTGTVSAPASATTPPLPDTDPPTPNPATFASPPVAVSSSEITMTATTGSDASPPVYYYFDETSENPGGTDSGWTTNPVYNDTGLQPSTQYTYTVQMRDSLLNTGTVSAPASATTNQAPTVPILQVDTGSCGPLQTGWISLGSCGTFTNVGGTGIDVLLATGNPGACECRNPGGSGTLANVEADLLFANDENYTPNADFILTLRNLTPGTNYTVYSYHNRSDEGDTTIPNVTVTGATNVTKPATILQSHAIMDNPAEITFTAGAGDVVIRYQGPDGGCAGCQAFFNGFELYGGGATIQFQSASSGALESVTPAQIPVILSNAETGQTYTVDYAPTGGTAQGGGVDYTLNPGTLTFLPDSTLENISIDIVNDGQDEEDETIVITLSNPTGPDVVLGDPIQHTYTIQDPRPTVEFDQASGSGMEDVTPVYVAVSLSAPATETTTVDYAVIGGTATGGGVDYTLNPGTLTFNINDVTKNIVIDIISDSNDQEPAETIIIGLSNPTHAKLGAQTQYTYTILSQMIHLKVDFAQVHCPDTATIRTETAKPGWWHWATGRWADMYAHDCAWACEQFPCPDGIDGTGITAAVTLILEGDLGMKVAGLTGALGGGVCPTGSPIYEPICNTWLQCIDWPEIEWGSIQLVFHNLPAGEWELYSYHNHFGCYREDPGEYTPVTCDCLCNPAPPMPEVRAMSCKAARELPYQQIDSWSKLFPGIDWTNGPWPEGVVSLLEAYNVQPQQVTTDAELVPSLIRFTTDGSPVLVLYKAGCCEPDPVRPTRVGGRGILNAFELIYVGGGAP